MTPQQALDYFIKAINEEQDSTTVRFGLFIYGGSTFVQNYDQEGTLSCVKDLRKKQPTYTIEDWKPILHNEIGHFIQSAQDNDVAQLLSHAQYSAITSLLIGDMDPACDLKAQDIKGVFILTHWGKKSVERHYLRQAKSIIPRVHRFVEQHSATLQ